MEELRDWHALRAAGHKLQGASLWNNASSFPNQGCSEAARAARAYGAGAAASCTKEQFEARARRAFDRYDDEKCGRLGREGVKLAFMELFGYKPTRYELASLIGQSSSHTATLPHPDCVEIPGATAEVGESGPEAQGSRIEFREFVEAMRPRAEVRAPLQRLVHALARWQSVRCTTHPLFAGAECAGGRRSSTTRRSCA
jgi:hypothetical protein